MNEDLKKRRDLLCNDIQHDLSGMDSVIQEGWRVTKIAENIETVIDDIDAQFEKATSICPADFPFLFFAAVLQTLRWAAMPELKLPGFENGELKVPIEDRLKPNEKKHIGGAYEGKVAGAQYELDELAKYRQKHIECCSAD